MAIINILSVLVLGAGLTLGAGGAGAQSLEPPANLPPPDFKGQQFVDNKGCVYIRAGVGGAVTWVPRVTRDRKQICGLAPSFAGQTAQAEKAAPEVVVIEAQSAPARSEPPARTKPAPAAAKTAPAPASAVAATPQVGPETRILPRHLYEQRKAQAPVKTPKGYRAAWQDGRLNPRRAEQTLNGQAQMRQVWTDTVPRRLVTE